MLPVFEFWPALIALAVLHLLAAMVPGPNTVVVSHLAAAQSRGAAFRAVAGVATATGTWVVVTLSGVAVVLHQAEGMFWLMRIAGALYLFYTGLRLLSALARSSGADGAAGPAAVLAPYRLGLLTNLLNPKSGVFWVSVFAVAVPTGAPTGFYVAAVALILVQTCLWYGLVALVFASGPARRLYRRAAKWLEGVAGLAMIGFGIKLAVAGR
ncbi:LysE family transporter [Thalassobaculum sp.]|uniref:LysE family transporter n=1 Tax=Thalassobaculum sp. TaxID=2022740 RepID=UPI0032F01C01